MDARAVRIERLPDAADSSHSVSLSVDCDALEHYLNFAPAGTRVGKDAPDDCRMMERLLDLFERHRARATFFCIADRLEVAPMRRLFQQALTAGHRVGNHTYSHPDLGTIDDLARVAEVRRGHDAIFEHLGVAPVGFRAPAYFVTPAMLGELCALGYRYDSSVCHSPMFDGAIEMLGMLRPSFKRKVRPLSLGRVANRESRMMVDERCLIEWPIPQVCGLPFYGTLHALLPRPVFFAQWSRAQSSRRHTHYEIHPIEVMDAASARAYPWVPTASLPEAKRMAWLDRRLAALTRHRVVTLEELTDHHLPAVH